MLEALQIADALAIAEASQRRSRDERAMVQYLGIGEKRRRASEPPAPPALLRADAIDLAAFESNERRKLEAALAQLSPEARRELIALVFLAQRPTLSFEAAMRRTLRIPPPAQTGYLMGVRLERFIALGLERLGYRL